MDVLVSLRSTKMNKVWSVTIKGKNDCVVMTDEEAAVITLKFAPDIEIYDMTERHGMKPEHLHKLDRMDSLDYYGPNITLMGKQPEYKKGEGPGMFGGAAKMIWEFKDLLEMEA